MKKLIEWIMYSLDIEMAQKLPIAVSFLLNQYIRSPALKKPMAHSVWGSEAGADPGFFLGGGALVSCSTSTPINHIVVFFSQNTSCIRKLQVVSGGVRTPYTLPLDPPLWSMLKVWMRDSARLGALRPELAQRVVEGSMQWCHTFYSSYTCSTAHF